MKYNSKLLHQFMIGVFAIILIQACEKQNSQFKKNNESKKDSISKVEITKVINDLYDVYTKSDLEWVDFYNEKYQFINTKGEVKEVYRDSLRNYWKGLYEKYTVVLNSRGEPELKISGNQVFHFNTFDEILINKKTSDTIINKGTWIVLWKKQKDNSWKIDFETYHSK